ncbi:MAG: crotonase, partial [Nitrospinae bacterium]|nr:crotonase [Nitrospinota bacterium]
RLTHLIGAIPAMGVILEGKSLSAKGAKKMGVVDYIVPERHLVNAACSIILDNKPEQKLPLLQQFINYQIIRPIIANIMRKKVARKAKKEHYPAPYAAIGVWEKYGEEPNKMMEAEAKSVANLIVGETSKNLVRTFFLQERMKSLGNKKTFQPEYVHVVGGGVMGGDIAAWCALQGMKVTVQDVEPKFLTGAVKRATALFNKKLKEPRLVTEVLDRFMPDHTASGVERADIIIEAIFENVEAKQNLYKSLEKRMKKGAILATNTSSIPLEILSKALKNPEKLVGIHFFNPVSMMQLVEIVKGGETSEETYQKALSFTRHISRLPLPVKSTPGFLVNRILLPYLVEAVTMESEGIMPEEIDKAALDFGMPMGPIELADKVGLDICLSVAEILAESFSIEVPERLKIMVNRGDKGVKTGRGFYHYKKGKPQKNRLEKGKKSDPDIQDRLIFRYLNEAVACLHEGVVEESDLLDAGMIFGTGFAPFRGGPMHYIETQGSAKMLKRLKELESRYGERFKPNDGWVRNK